MRTDKQLQERIDFLKNHIKIVEKLLKEKPDEVKGLLKELEFNKNLLSNILR